MSSVLERMYLDDSLIKLSLEAEDKNLVLEEIALLLKNGGYVKESFSNAIKEREVHYPTGLQLEHIGVAIPHTDAEFVNEQSMAIAILKNPVSFTFMGSEDVLVPVKVVFMLAIKEPHAQLEFLQALMELFQNDELVLDIVNSNSEKEVVEKFKKYIS
ncbi:MAG: PTS sugar transporter subunit IIA [Streptococcus sp.]|jgi:possible PTS family fructose/mannitol porter component IIA|nr:PTS sugar transporter subunit IIA [Streptococcus sp.]